jgi:hypothetical protein
VGARLIRKPLKSPGLVREQLTMATILAAIALPMSAGYYFIGREARPDFSDYLPQAIAAADGSLLVSWSSLRQGPRFSDQPANPIPPHRSVVSIAGYMMDGYQYVPDGSSAKMFVLMPETGHILHPAHRIPDEMVEVWPREGRIVFESRKLIWVTGRLVKQNVPMQGERALYALQDAVVDGVRLEDITRWFKP